jgi:hypothetical protein
MLLVQSGTNWFMAQITRSAPPPASHRPDKHVSL